MKGITIKKVLKVKRPILGNTISVSFWRMLRLIAMPNAFGTKTKEFDRKLGLEMGELLNIKKPEDIVQAIEDAQIGICAPLEKKKGLYVIALSECFTCSGIEPPVGQPICDFEGAIIEGAVTKVGLEVKDVKETKCIGGLGNDVCKFEIRIQKSKINEVK